MLQSKIISVVNKNLEKDQCRIGQKCWENLEKISQQNF